MITVADQATYERYRATRDASWNAEKALYELALPMLLFGSLGAITWAIRGTSGWGGIDGTIVPGMTWGLLWYYLCWRKGIDARGIALWLGLGIALGGELGYGQYVSWIRGMFNVGEEIIDISPWTGYAWFVICGIGWAAPGGILLGWALGRSASPGWWCVQFLFLLVLLLILLGWPFILLEWSFIDWMGGQFARVSPGLLFPHADQGLYAGELDKHLGRTVYTNTQNFLVLVWWVAAMIMAVVRCDRHTLVAGGIIGGGFGLGFAQSAMWCLGYVHAPRFIDWWKMWELNAGFNLGLLYVLVLYWTMRQVDKTHEPNGEPLARSPLGASATSIREWSRSIISVLFLALALLGSFLERALPTAIFLSLFYIVVILWALWRDRKRELGTPCERVLGVSLTYSLFLLLFVLFHGGTFRGGVVLGLYGDEAIDQYAWPAGRFGLFAPLVILLLLPTLYSLGRILLRSDAAAPGSDGTARLPQRMVDLVTVIVFIGAISIWPAKISILYALLACFALYALTRLNEYFDWRDRKRG